RWHEIIMTIFHYTTLFRSHPPRHVETHRWGCASVPLVGLITDAIFAPKLLAVLSRQAGTHRNNPILQVSLTSGPCPCVQARTGGDRKSTRLNSSHVKISYA